MVTLLTLLILVDQDIQPPGATDMVTTTSSGGEGATSSTSPSSSPFQQQDDAQGYLLLTLEDVTVVQVSLSHALWTR